MRAHKSCAVHLRVEIVAGNGENDLPSREISQNDGCFSVVKQAVLTYEKRCSTQQLYLGQGFFNVFQMQPRFPYAHQVGRREGIHRVLANQLLDLTAKSDKN